MAALRLPSHFRRNHRSLSLLGLVDNALLLIIRNCQASLNRSIRFILWNNAVIALTLTPPIIILAIHFHHNFLASSLTIARALSVIVFNRVALLLLDLLAIFLCQSIPHLTLLVQIVLNLIQLPLLRLIAALLLMRAPLRT